MKCALVKLPHFLTRIIVNISHICIIQTILSQGNLGPSFDIGIYRAGTDSLAMQMFFV